MRLCIYCLGNYLAGQAFYQRMQAAKIRKRVRLLGG
jgi:hypothetical protein